MVKLYCDLMYERMLRWDDPPVILSRVVDIRKEMVGIVANVRIVGGMQDYNHVETVLQFPPLVKREPVYTRVPFYLAS